MGTAIAVVVVGGTGWVTINLKGVVRPAYADPLRLEDLTPDQRVLVGDGDVGPVVLWPVPGG